MIEFWVNDEHIITDEPEGMLVLDFVRKKLHRTGTKEGCKEGDCGACSVMLGELRDGQVDYRVMTSCLMPLGEVHGKHVVTVEGVGTPARLNPVQDAMVQTGGSQCGYCTPGFIVSMTWWMMADRSAPTMDGFKRAVSGNLCRCTGYNSIKRAGETILHKFEDSGELKGIWTDPRRQKRLVERGMLPGYFLEMAGRLAKISSVKDAGQPVDFYVGGGTDLYVQKGEYLPGANVAILARNPRLRGFRSEESQLVFGALTTFEEFAENPEIREIIPDMDSWMWMIASLHLRNRATIAGNIVNASPIGDMSNLMLALDAELVLQKGDVERVVALKDFYLGYKKLDKDPHELVLEIRIPRPANGTRIRFEKVAKRKALDIATVNSGAKIRISDDGNVDVFSVSAGGVAAFPLKLQKTEAYLVGRKLDEDSAREAVAIAMGEISPISDVRGSADYKRLLTRNLVISHLMSVSDLKIESFS